MDRAFYWKVALILALVLGAFWLLVPSYYYFKLPPEERNQTEKLEALVPGWAPSAKTRLNLGLDLQGGIHLVLGVDTESAIKSKARRRGDHVTEFAKEKSIPGIQAQGQGDRVRVTAENAADRERFQKLAGDYFQDMRIVDVGETAFTLAYQDQFLRQLKTESVDQALKVISNRVNRWGVTEPIIAKRGDNAILVQLPGFKDPARAKELLGKTAQLEFKIVDDENPYFSQLTDLPEGVTLETESHDGPSGIATSYYLKAMGENGRTVLEDLVKNASTPMPDGREMGMECIASRVKKGACDGYRTYLLNAKTELTGDTIVDARVLVDQSGGGGNPYVSLAFDAQGAHDFERITGENIKRRMAIVLDQTVNSAPVIQAKIAGGNAQITMGGLRNYEEIVQDANDLALVLKAGALPAPVTIGEERTVGASLGPELIRKGSYSVVLGLCLVFLFMVLYYKMTGFIANIALVMNGLLILATMAFMNATLTLPGIAGFVLSLGMAIDANVLINERIREELRHGKTPRASVEAGYGHAFSAIIDSHVTTLIAGFVLLRFGSGPIRGFAVMLIIGMVASLFTSIVVTRTILDWLMLGRGWNKISV